MTEKPGAPPVAAGVTYDTQVQGIRIFPGQWRPHYPWEQIAWISPPWPSQDYLWLDFPEAIFTDQGLLYLSAANPKFPVRFPNLPKVAWQTIPGGLAFERTLPNGVRFGGSVLEGANATTVDLQLHLANHSDEGLTHIMLQTCLFLRAAKEFADYTGDNKFVHVSSRGWVSFAEAHTLPEADAPYRIGWRLEGKPLLDLPAMVTVSNQAERLVAMTWGKDTFSMPCNPRHPCMHADPHFHDLAPGDTATIRGKLIFFEGGLQDFTADAHLRNI